MLKGLKNTRTKQHKARRKTNHLVEYTTKQQKDQHWDHRLRTVSRINNSWGGGGGGAWGGVVKALLQSTQFTSHLS